MNKKMGLKSRAMKTLGVSTILSTLVLPMAAYAAEPQDAPAPAPDQAEDQSAGLGEIVVTATRQATSIQKVPISMQALSADVLGQRQVKGLTDFAAL
ncbi:MAG: TonB-dependent receptor, partial [Novosphingobium sp.]